MSRGSLPPLEDDFSRALLGSAEADAPSHAAYAKAAAALGIGVGLGVGASIPASAAVAVGTASAAGVARWSSSLGAKLLALGVSGALLVGAGALLFPGRGARVSQTRPVPASHAAAAAVVAVTAGQVVAVAPPIDLELPGSAAASASPSPATAQPATHALSSSALRALSAPVSARRSTRPTAAAPARAAKRAAANSSLSEQVQSLDRARVALGSGDSSSALREIAHYRATWPDGVFLTEASVLEIEALAARGERTLTAKHAADFVAAHPDSPQAVRLRALIPAGKR